MSVSEIARLRLLIGVPDMCSTTFGDRLILSTDVADCLGCSREMARRKLAALYDRGNVNRRKVARRVLYWRPDEPSPSSDPQQRVTAPADQAGSNMTGDATREAADTADETPPSTGNVDRDRLCDTLPGSGEILEEACLDRTAGEVLAEVNVDATIEDDDPANVA